MLDHVFTIIFRISFKIFDITIIRGFFYFIEVTVKMKEVDMLWDELMENVTTRANTLDDTLAKAEQFWNELKSCQKVIDETRLRIEEIQPVLGEPTTIEQQRNILQVC